MLLLSKVIIVVSTLKSLSCDDNTDELPHVSMEDIYMGETTASDNVPSAPEGTIAPGMTESPFEGRNTDPNLSWLNKAIRDVAYYLRAYKFSEYDRRYITKTPETPGEYFSGFPKPPLRSLHWEIHKYCELSFVHCMQYLNKRVKDTTLRREDDTSYVITDQNWTIVHNSQQINSTEATCKELRRRDDKFAVPFQGLLERFQWRTTASYYMCWYTMNGVPDLKYFGEPCDNYARCLDSKYGANNKDPRASDAKPFFCALYSLCPDPCCPLRHITNSASCRNSTQNPCFSENQHDKSKLECLFNRNQNKDFRDIILNRWNVTCHCQKPGYVWESRYGMCVDINECTSNKHNCDKTKEVCLNLPGSFRCACNWGYIWDKKVGQCSISQALIALKRVPLEKDEVKSNKAKSLLKSIYYKIFGKSISSVIQITFPLLTILIFIILSNI